jgi:GNAT superfamily N-acetyltransferase
MGYELVSPADSDTWQAYHDIRRVVLFEARGRVGVYDEHHPDDSTPGHYPKLLLHDQKPVGVIRIDIHRHTAILRRVAIRAEAQRKGHGRVMLSLAQDFAANRGCRRLTSSVAPDAVGFYEKCGFVIDSQSPMSRGSILMTKHL